MEAILNAENLWFLVVGALLSLLLAIGALIMGIILGIFGAMGRISKNVIARSISTVYVQVIRGTPMLLQLLFLFLGLPVIFKSITGNIFSPDPFVIGLVAMGINSGAYTTELIRSGIQSVSKGQLEAGRSLGLSYGQTMRHIILPQAFKNIIPPLVSEFIVLIKDSSLVSVLGAAELLRRARILGTRYFAIVPPLLAASAMYLIMTMIISKFASKLEERLKNQ
jgi:polar amino acid transport system permease protein